jgi:hypothetical protein
LRKGCEGRNESLPSLGKKEKSLGQRKAFLLLAPCPASSSPQQHIDSLQQQESLRVLFLGVVLTMPNPSVKEFIKKVNPTTFVCDLNKEGGKAKCQTSISVSINYVNHLISLHHPHQHYSISHRILIV